MSVATTGELAAMRAAVASPERLYFTERGSGPPLLLVHGLMVTGDMFAPVVDRFATTHRELVPDLRGHGRSRALPPPYTAGQLAADLAGLLQQLGIASAAVLGYSQGVPSPSNSCSTGRSTATASSSRAPTPSTWRRPASR